MTQKSEEIVQKICQTIFDKKGLNPLALFIGDFSTVADYLIVAEGNVDRHVIAIAQDIIKELKNENLSPHHVEGLQTGDWVLLDYNDIIVHIFMPGVREKYQLERLFVEGKILPLNFTSQMV
jgi:ribosome-associated protein